EAQALDEQGVDAEREDGAQVRVQVVRDDAVVAHVEDGGDVGEADGRVRHDGADAPARHDVDAEAARHQHVVDGRVALDEGRGDLADGAVAGGVKTAAELEAFAHGHADAQLPREDHVGGAEHLDGGDVGDAGVG